MKKEREIDLSIIDPQFTWEYFAKTFTDTNHIDWIKYHYFDIVKLARVILISAINQANPM